jgi:RNA polymerase sigma-70 factor (ECF subfamily)
MNPPGPDPLLLDLAAGREQAFAELFDRYGQRLYRVAAELLRRREDAEDAVQDVFTALVRSRRKLSEVQDLTAYLFTALRRAAGRQAERRAREPVASTASVIDLVAKTDEAEESPCRRRLLQAIQELPPLQREVLILKIDGELTFAQIAQVVKISINTAASRYRYALVRLRTVLGEQC